MAYAIDNTQRFTITLTSLAEGFGKLSRIIVQNHNSLFDYIYTVSTASWDPSPPEAIELDKITLIARIHNDGIITDTLFGQFVSKDVMSISPLIQELTVGYADYMEGLWRFIMPPTDVGITINAGHVE